MIESVNCCCHGIGCNNRANEKAKISDDKDLRRSCTSLLENDNEYVTVLPDDDTDSDLKTVSSEGSYIISSKRSSTNSKSRKSKKSSKRSKKSSKSQSKKSIKNGEKSRKSRHRKEKKERKKSSNTTSSSYQRRKCKMGEHGQDIYQSLAPTRRSKVLPLPKKRLAKMENADHKGYLGVKTRREAEKCLGARKFAIYHQLEFPPILLNMQKEVHISAVYRSLNGEYSHFAVREHISDDNSHNFYIDNGRSTIPELFPSIDKLRLHYCFLETEKASAEKLEL